jgi:hypothetical protein
MTNTNEFFERYEPGQLIEAGRMNAMQAKIKQEIDKKIAAAKDEIKKTGVERADNADKFDNKTPLAWTNELDQRYAPKVHDHEGLASYRRYFKRLEANQIVVLEHKLGRFPLVDIYDLLSIDMRVIANEPRIPEKFYVYYHHEERDRDVLYTRDRGATRWPWGTPIEQLLLENQVQWEDDDSLGDVVNDLFDAFFKPPFVDHMEHRTSKWIDDHRESLIGDLKKRDEWPDIRWVVRPHKGEGRLVVPLPAAPVPDNREIPIQPTIYYPEVEHLSYDALSLKLANVRPADAIVDLMILLRS